MSAQADSTDAGPIEQVKVLFTLFPGYNTLDVAGPLEVLSRSLQDSKKKGKEQRLQLFVILSASRYHAQLTFVDTPCRQQGLSVPICRHHSGYDVCPRSHHQGRHGLRRCQ